MKKMLLALSVLLSISNAIAQEFREDELLELNKKLIDVSSQMYNSAMFLHNENNTIDQIVTLVNGIHEAYNKKKYEGLSTSKIYKLGILQKTDEISTDNISNPFGGSVELKISEAIKGKKNSAFILTYTKLPRKVCIDLATANWGISPENGFITLSANNKFSEIPWYIDKKYMETEYESKSMTNEQAEKSCYKNVDNEVSLKFH